MYDIAIIGSGPAGLSAAVYAKRAGKNVIIIEKDYDGAGQITSGNHVDNYLGLPGISGMEIGAAFRNHVTGLNVIPFNANVISISRKEDFEIEVDDIVSDTAGYSIVTEGDKGRISAKSIVYATGASHRMLGAKGEEELSGMGVSYCATCDGALYKNAKVIVVGGGDTAIDDALYLSEIAEEVTLIHRRDTFRAAAGSVETLRSKANVNIITGVNIKEILGEDEVTGVILDNGTEIEAEGIFIAVGMLPRTDLIKNLVELDDAGYIKASEDGRTNVKGFYVAGDVRTKALRQVVTAVSDGANCINSILQDMN